MIQARKPCGCVTAACYIDPVDPSPSKKFAKEYAAEGYKIEIVSRQCTTMSRRCAHGPIKDQTPKTTAIVTL